MENVESTAAFSTLVLQEGVWKGEVANAVEYFSFSEEVQTDGSAIEVYVDEEHTVRSSLTAQLREGDNRFYLLERAAEQTIATFLVEIRRRPLYEVRFDIGGEDILTQTVEENCLAREPQAVRLGYTLIGWDYDFALPITQDTFITAAWKANTDTPYAVEYYLQNVENDEYTLFLREEFTGTTDTLAYAEIKEFSHFKPVAQGVTGNISGDGKSALKVYYTRETYTVTFEGAGGVLMGGESVQEIRYQGAAIPPTYEKKGYELLGFDKPLHGVCEDMTITAIWRVVEYKITYILNGAVNHSDNPQSYTVETETIALQAPMGALNGYDGGFLEWQSAGVKIAEIPKGSYGDITLIAKGEKAIFKIEGGYVTGLTAHGKTLSEIRIPETLDGEKIVAIGEGAFKSRRNITTLTMPASVTEIGALAFYECESLQSVEIPQNVTKIKEWAFAYCKRLREVTLPRNVTHIGEMAFAQCENITSIHVGDKLQKIDAWAFYLCQKLTKITFAGTRQAWKSITKGFAWNGQTPVQFVDCKDGAWQIPKE